MLIFHRPVKKNNEWRQRPEIIRNLFGKVLRGHLRIGYLPGCQQTFQLQIFDGRVVRFIAFWRTGQLYICSTLQLAINGSELFVLEDAFELVPVVIDFLPHFFQFRRHGHPQATAGKAVAGLEVEVIAGMETLSPAF